MKNKLPEFYQPDFNKLWNECYFIFDTNTLLNLYRYSEETRSKFIQILESYADRLWIPYQVAFEVHKNRKNVIFERETIYDTCIDEMNNSFKQIKEVLHTKRYPDKETLKKLVDESLDNIINEIKINQAEDKKKNPSFADNDTIIEKLTILFENKVGDPYSEKDMSSRFKEADDRFQNNIPPGFRDDKNKDNPHDKYGDYILWKQILDFADKTKSPVIFITDDSKDDWWWKVKGRTIGARPELIKEITQTSKNLFHMYTSENFIKYANKQKGKESSESVLKEIRDIRNSSRHILNMELKKPNLLNLFEQNNPKICINEPSKKELMLIMHNLKIQAIISNADENAQVKTFYKNFITTFDLTNRQKYQLREGLSNIYTTLDKNIPNELFNSFFKLCTDIILNK